MKVSATKPVGRIYTLENIAEHELCTIRVALNIARRAEIVLPVDQVIAEKLYNETFNIHEQ